MAGFNTGYGDTLGGITSGIGGTAAAVSPWIGIGESLLGALGQGASQGEQNQLERDKMAQQARQFLMSLNQQRSQQGDDRGRTAASLASKQAMLPLMEQGMAGLQSRFQQGPATFGQTGAQNQAMQQAAQNYRPGQNPAMAQYGADIGSLKGRFMAPPGDLASQPSDDASYANTPWAGAPPIVASAIDKVRNEHPDAYNAAVAKWQQQNHR